MPLMMCFTAIFNILEFFGYIALFAVYCLTIDKLVAIVLELLKYAVDNNCSDSVL